MSNTTTSLWLLYSSCLFLLTTAKLSACCRSRMPRTEIIGQANISTQLNTCWRNNCARPIRHARGETYAHWIGVATSSLAGSITALTSEVCLEIAHPTCRQVVIGSISLAAAGITYLGASSWALDQKNQDQQRFLAQRAQDKRDLTPAAYHAKYAPYDRIFKAERKIN